MIFKVYITTIKFNILPEFQDVEYPTLKYSGMLTSRFHQVVFQNSPDNLSFNLL